MVFDFNGRNQSIYIYSLIIMLYFVSFILIYYFAFLFLPVYFLCFYSDDKAVTHFSHQFGKIVFLIF